MSVVVGDIYKRQIVFDGPSGYLDQLNETNRENGRWLRSFIPQVQEKLTTISIQKQAIKKRKSRFVVYLKITAAHAY